MDAQTTSSLVITKSKRPIGVWISTLWTGLLAGAFPLGLVLIFYFGPANGSKLISVFQLLLSLSLGLGIIASAVGTWRGYSAARYTLVALVAVHYLLIAYQNYQLAVAGIEVRGSTTIPWARVVRSLLTAAVISGYLLFAPRAREFFARKYKAT